MKKLNEMKKEEMLSYYNRTDLSKEQLSDLHYLIETELEAEFGFHIYCDDFWDEDGVITCMCGFNLSDDMYNLFDYVNTKKLANAFLRCLNENMGGGIYKSLTNLNPIEVTAPDAKYGDYAEFIIKFEFI